MFDWNAGDKDVIAKLRIVAEAWKPLLMVSPTALTVLWVAEWATAASSKEVLQCIGLLAQFAGMTVVAYDLIGRLTEYGAPKPWERFMAWLVRLVGTLPIRAASGADSFGEGTDSGEARVDRPLPADASLEDRVVRLEETLRREVNRLDQHKAEAAKNLRAVNARIDDETHRLDDRLDGVKNSLKQRAVGGADREWLGWGWTLQGTLLGGLNNAAGPWLFSLLH